MSKYEFSACEITRIATLKNDSLRIEVDMNTPQAKAAFMTLAGDCRLNELGEWMLELGYNISEVES